MIQNAKWIIVCKIAQSLLQMVVGMLSARYLGPSNYGLISYAASVVAFAAPLMQLGLKDILVQEYVTKPERTGEIFGTALAMNALSAVACMVGVVSFAAVANPGEPTTIIVCGLYSVSLLFQAMEAFQYWFQANLLSKYSSVALLFAHIVLSAYKIYLLVAEKSVYWFALSHAVEYCTAGLLMFLSFRHIAGQKISISVFLAKDMFSRSKYYILAALMVTVFQNTDHIMLKMIAGNTENGYYTTAITCTIIVSFVYSAIIDSMRPVILESKAESQALFEKNVTRLYSLMVYMTAMQSVCFTILAKPIVLILYGREYLPAIPVLQIIVWQLAFSYMGTVRNVWILGEGKHNQLWIINLCGVVANVILNAIMIPLWGACGAALASVLTQFVTNFVVGFFMKSIRRNNVLLLRGFNPKYLLEMLPARKKSSGA